MADDNKTPAGAADRERKPAKKKKKLTGTVKGAGYIPDTERPAAVVIDAVADQAGQEEIDIKKVLETTAATFANMDIQKMMQDANETLADIPNKIQEAGKVIAAIDTDKIISDVLLHLRDLADELQGLQPYIDAELQKPEYAGKSFKDLAAQTEDGTTLFAQVIRAAQEARNADKDKNLLPQVYYNNSKEVQTVTDKLVNVFFSMTAQQPRGTINGQRQFIPVRYERGGAKKEITLYYDYSFNEDIVRRFGLSKEFDDQAFFVASIIDNLLEEGNRTVSLSKIWHELGNDGNPSTEALTTLVNILRLGMSTIITANIAELNEAWALEKDGKKEPEIISPVIPVQILQEKFVANGKTANAVINITGHTPFYIIGRPLNHITTWNKDILRLYKGRRTKRYFRVLRFLITQIGWLRNPNSKRNNKILYSTLYEYTGDKTTRARQLARDMMYRLLDEVFIPTGYITAYKEDTTGKPGVLLSYKKTPRLPKNKK